MTDPQDPFAVPDQPSGQQPPPPPGYGPPPPGYGTPPPPPGYGQPGYPPPYGMPGYASDKTNTMAIVALVTAFFCGLVGVITGIIALRQVETSGEKGRGLAIAGICVGAASMLLGAALSFR